VCMEMEEVAAVEVVVGTWLLAPPLLPLPTRWCVLPRLSWPQSCVCGIGIHAMRDACEGGGGAVTAGKGAAPVSIGWSSQLALCQCQ
jgi:hypothetical protein